jgi:hypothetical protein
VHAAGRERDYWTPKNYDRGAFSKRFLLALDRLFPRKTTVGAPNQRQRFVELFPALAQALVQTLA